LTNSHDIVKNIWHHTKIGSMRDIKFRGKRIDNGEWVYGDLLQSGEHRFIMPEVAGWHEFYDATVKLDPSTVGQYTGLKDKNGKEIYEGDIDNDGGICAWCEADASFFWDYRGLIYQDMGEDPDWCEIKGNIHDNPELLKLEA
jgi:hypothetical protein